MSYRLAHVYVDTGSESVDIFGGPIKALRRVNHVAAINTCSAITTLTCSSSKLGQINASRSTPIGEVGQEVEIWIETEEGVTLPVFLRARISAITSDGPFTVIEAEPECSILQSYTAGARDADGTSYSGEVTVCSVMRELATIRLGEVSDPSTHIDREYGVVADSTGTVMGSTSSWTYPTPPATRADLLMRLSRLSAWPNLEDQPVQPMVFYPHHGGRTLTITRYGNGYYSMVAPVKTISKSEGHIIGRIEYTPEDVDNITNKALIQFQDRNRLNLVFQSSIDKYGAREERINAKELEVTEDVIRLAQGIAYLHGLPSSAISLTARYDRIVSDLHRGVLNRTYRVIDRQAGEDVDLGEHVVVRYELDMPSFRVHLRLRKRGWTEADLSGLLAGTGRRIDKLEKASLDTSTLANVTAAREAVTRGAVESLSDYVSGSVVPAHNALAGDVSNLTSAHNTLVGDVSSLASAHNTLVTTVEEDIVPRVSNNEAGILWLYNNVLRSTSFELSANNSRLTLSNGMTVLWRESTITVPNNQTDYNFSMFLGITMYVYHVQLTLQALSPGYAPTVLYNFNLNTTQQTASLPISIHRNPNANETTYRVHAMVVGTI